MVIIKTSDWLIGENKAGGKKFWRLHILRDGTNYYTQTSWYQLSRTGRETKRQLSDPYYATPTNEGRANARDSKEQAEFEFEAVIKKQRDKGFGYDGETRQMYPMPMLAHKFTEHKGKMEFPVFVQPKLNGMRVLFDGKNGWSRGNKEVIPQVIQHLTFDTGGVILDGELMLPNNVLLQESMSAIKKYRPGISDKLKYYVYDIVDATKSYDERFALLVEMFSRGDLPKNVVLVGTASAQTEIEVFGLHKTFVAEGFEGTMVRDPRASYEIGKRSYSLLKLKDFVDAEYKITAVIDGDGSDRGLAIFVLDNGHGQQFNCRPEGTQENRAELFRNRKTLVNSFLTVRYQELSRDNIPIFPVGVGIRDLKDFS